MKKPNILLNYTTNWTSSLLYQCLLVSDVLSVLAGIGGGISSSCTLVGIIVTLGIDGSISSLDGGCCSVFGRK